MINYSIVMRSVNANLLEINQAKKEGKNPDPKDLEDAAAFARRVIRE